MSKEYKQKPLEQIHEELFEAGLTPNEIKQHIMDVTWFRYLDTLTPFEAIFRQTAVPQASHSHGDTIDDDWLEEAMTPEELEYVEEAIAEREREKQEFEQMKVDVKAIKDKWNDVLIEQYFSKMVADGSIGSNNEDGNDDLKDKDSKSENNSKKEKGE